MKIAQSDQQCMECRSASKARFVMTGVNMAVEVTDSEGKRIGLLHAECKESWISKHDGGVEKKYKYQPA